MSVIGEDKLIRSEILPFDIPSKQNKLTLLIFFFFLEGENGFPDDSYLDRWWYKYLISVAPGVVGKIWEDLVCFQPTPS